MKRAATTPGPKAGEHASHGSHIGHGDHESLTFVWPERSASFVLPIFFLLAVLFHAAAFYLFQIVYPPSTAVAPPTAQLLYISPDTPENMALLQWVDAQIPATVARVRDTPLPSELRPIRYTPSYETPGTLPKNADLTPPPVLYPVAYNSLAPLSAFAASGESATPAPGGSQPPPRSVPSTFRFSESLRPFENREAPPLFPAAAGEPEAVGQKQEAEPSLHTYRSLQPTSFFIGLNRRGELHYTFAQESSGNKELDQRAALYLHDYPFRHPEKEPAREITWGTVTFTWGAEAYDAQAAPEQPAPSETPETPEPTAPAAAAPATAPDDAP